MQPASFYLELPQRRNRSEPVVTRYHDWLFTPSRDYNDNYVTVVRSHKVGWQEEVGGSIIDKQGITLVCTLADFLIIAIGVLDK
jgi:hypothetical protein